MILAPEFLRDAAIGVAVVRKPEELTHLLKSDCGAALWQRKVLPDFQRWIDGLTPENLPRGRLILRPDAVRDAVAQLCDLADMPDRPHRTRLIDDIAALSDIFAKLMDARWLRLRLNAVTTNACRKFHVDAITARLVCTYRGAGTQYGNAPRGRSPDRVVMWIHQQRRRAAMSPYESVLRQPQVQYDPFLDNQWSEPQVAR